MKNCSLCSGAKDFYYGLEGKRYSDKRIFLILNHADERVNNVKNYKNILLSTWTGKSLNIILKSCELDFEDVYLTNFVKCVFPDKKEPGVKEYRNCKSVLEKQIKEISPKVILLFGPKPYENLFPYKSSKSVFKDMVGKEREYNDIPCLVNLHPSTIHAKISLEKRKKHYLPIQNFLLKYGVCKKIMGFPEQLELNL